MHGRRSAGKPQYRKKTPAEPIRRPPLNLKYMLDDNDVVDPVPKSLGFPAVLLTFPQLMCQEATAPERRNPVAETMATEAASIWARVPAYFAVSTTRQLPQSRFRVKYGTASMLAVRAAALNWSPAKWRDKPRE